MKKIMKMNGSITNDNKPIKGLGEYICGIYLIHTYEWTCGDTEYSLVYDNTGDLYGIITNEMPQDILDNIVEEPYNYNFPPTLDDYMDEYAKNNNILWSMETNDEISPCKLGDRQKELDAEYRNRLFNKNVCHFIFNEVPLNKWTPIPTRLYREPIYRKNFIFYVKIIEK